ncbi:DUF6924 domain-containing protein [Nocardia nova]|uniref:DUF6924 domain-containing protein n=1 Tax=Nocardia nova TaxID=37330 RepID=UPI003F76DFDF
MAGKFDVGEACDEVPQRHQLIDQNRSGGQEQRGHQGVEFGVVQRVLGERAQGLALARSPLPQGDSILVRTAFTDDAAWARTPTAVTASYDEDTVTGLTPVDETAFVGLTPAELVGNLNQLICIQLSTWGCQRARADEPVHGGFPGLRGRDRRQQHLRSDGGANRRSTTETIRRARLSGYRDQIAGIERQLGIYDLAASPRRYPIKPTELN